MTGDKLPYHQLRDPLLLLVGAFTGESEEVVRRRVGTHSLRSGGGTIVAASGESDRLFQAHGGGRSAVMKDHYVKDLTWAKLSVTRALGTERLRAAFSVVLRILPESGVPRAVTYRLGRVGHRCSHRSVALVR
jgi:hypothetical protein